MRGGRHILSLGEGSWPFCFGPEDSKKGRKRSKKLFHFHFLNSTYFSERFSEIIFKKCLNDSCQKEKPSRSMLSSEGRN